MQIRWNDVVPVLISMCVIIFVAVAQRHSKVVAAVTATMPITVPLALWIVYSSSSGERVAVESFTRSLVDGMVPTLAFAVAVWAAARLGLKLVPMIAVGYSMWALTLLAMLGIHRALGR